MPFVLKQNTGSRLAAGSGFEKTARVLLFAAAIAGVAMVNPLSSDILQTTKFFLFVGLTSLAGLFWALALKFHKKVLLCRADIYALAVLIIAALIALLSPSVWSAIFGGLDRRTTLSLATIVSFAAFIFLGRQVFTRENLLCLRSALVWILSVSSFLFLLRAFTPLLKIYPVMGLSPLSRLPAEIALFAAVNILLAVWLLLESKAVYKKILLAAGSLGSLAVLVLIGEPRAWAALFFGALVLAVSYAKNFQVKNIKTIAAIAIVVISAPLAVFGTPKFARLALPPEIKLSLTDSINLTGQSLTANAKQFFLGAGFGAYPSVFGLMRPASVNQSSSYSALAIEPAGIIFLATIEGGVILLALFVSGFFALLWIILRELFTGAKKREASKEYWPLAIVAAILAGAIFAIPSFSIVALFSIVLGFACLLNRQDKTEKKIRQSGPVALVAVILFLVGFVQPLRALAADAFFSAANRDFQKGDFESAVKNVYISWRILPDPRYLLAKSQALTQIAASAESDEKQRSDAIAVLKQAANIALPMVEYHVAIVQSALSLPSGAETNELAKKEIETVLSFSPTNPALLIWAGDSYFRLNEPEQARKLYALSIGVKSDLVEALTRLAQLDIAKNDIKSAFENLQKANQFAPQDRNVLGLYVSAAETLGEPGALDSVLAALLTYLREAPEDKDAISAYSRVAERRGRYDDALSAVKRLLELSPNDETIKNKAQELEKQTEKK
jgi:tetratricopeptide (TPR) repeat protein